MTVSSTGFVAVAGSRFGGKARQLDVLLGAIIDPCRFILHLDFSPHLKKIGYESEWLDVIAGNELENLIKIHAAFSPFRIEDR